MPQSKNKKGGRTTPKKVKEQTPGELIEDGSEEFSLDVQELRIIDRRKLSAAEEQASQWEAVARSEKKLRQQVQEELQKLRTEIDQLIAERSDSGSEEKKHVKSNKGNGSNKARKVRQDR
jgi:hypothetical protein